MNFLLVHYFCKQKVIRPLLVKFIDWFDCFNVYRRRKAAKFKL